MKIILSRRGEGLKNDQLWASNTLSWPPGCVELLSAKPAVFCSSTSDVRECLIKAEVFQTLSEIMPVVRNKSLSSRETSFQHSLLTSCLRVTIVPSRLQGQALLPRERLGREVTGPEAGPPGSNLASLLTGLLSWARYFTSLCLSFPSWKMRQNWYWSQCCCHDWGNFHTALKTVSGKCVNFYLLRVRHSARHGR